jgi:hypothetical protein
MAFFSTWCPAGTSIKTLVAIEGHRWALEDCCETSKNELGLDHTHRHPIRPSRPSSQFAEAQIHRGLTNPSKPNIITSIRGSRRQVADIKSEPWPASNR